MEVVWMFCSEIIEILSWRYGSSVVKSGGRGAFVAGLWKLCVGFVVVSGRMLDVF